MVVLDCTTLEVDQYASLDLLAFVECVDAVDGELISDTKEILGSQEGIDHVEGMTYDMELVELPRLH